MPTKTEENMHFYFIDSDGNWQPFNGIVDAESIPMVTSDEPYSAECLKELAEMEFIFEATTKARRGMYDVIAGRIWTKAAQRYIRWSKRQKEKQRRLKLKEGIGHEYADMGRA